MAARTDMGEVEETHNKQGDGAKEDVLNGELKNDVKCSDADGVEEAEEAEKINQLSETEEGMDVDEEHSKGNSSVEQCEENTEVDGEGDEEDSVDFKQETGNKVKDAEKSDDEDKNEPTCKDIGDVDSVSEIMHSENSADSEIHNVDDNTSSDSEETEEVDEESEDTLDSKINGKNGLNGAPHEQNSSTAIVLNDSVETDEDSETDVELDEDDCLPKENGEAHRIPEPDKDDVIDLDTPVKNDPSKSRKDSITPRRSSRNLNRSTSYLNDEERSTSSDEESDIEEVMPEDPLGSSEHYGGDKIVKKVLQLSSTSTIVVKDTKRLVEIASKSTNQKTSNQNTGKKEPTLVIIDTNSILSGRGPIPMAHKASLSQSSTSPYNTLPAALPAQGIYPPNMRATITPIPTPKAQPQPQPPAPILPSLTDDMFVVEAPSFIVPYVYEKPPVNDLRKYVDEIKVKLDKVRKQEELKKAEEKKRRKREEKDDDDDGTDTDEEGDEKKGDDPSKEGKISPDVVLVKETKKSHLFFDSPIGKFFVDIGVGLVQEFVQTDLLKQQKRKRDREHGLNHETNRTIQSLIKNLEFSKENNEAFHMEIKKCEFCNYKTESSLAMKYHLETPHMKNYVYKCNFCPFEVRSPHDILLHMEAEHCLRGRLERAPAFHQCPSCPFEDNQKGKLSRHLVACARKFKPERNLEPPLDWEPPAKIPRLPRLKPNVLGGPLNSSSAAAAAAAMYQAMAKSGQYNLLSKMQGIGSSPTNAASLQAAAAALQQQQAALNRGRGRPSLAHTPKQALPQHMIRGGQVSGSPGSTGGMVFKQTMSGGSVLLPAAYQLGGAGGNQLYQVVGKEISGRLTGPMTFVPNLASATGITLQSPSNKKTSHQPSISITPLPRGSGSSSSSSTSSAVASVVSSTGLSNLKPGDSSGSKSSFVICEICDGYIKDLEQLRNHMHWIHKVKIHPKMIYNRPPLNCQKCQFRFFTDQGLERHLLGSHGLVTSSMQEAANRNDDSGRCPVCGRTFQWKLLGHVARDHNMILKPAHLSYKCTVCTATFGMYKQFENHVYSAHSVVAKRVIDKKQQVAAATKQLSGSPGESILKPLKINDEITIIPQMPKSNTITSTIAGSSSNGTSAAVVSKNAVKLNQVVAAATAAAAAAAQQQGTAAQASSSKEFFRTRNSKERFV